jgi:polyphosphate kinase
LNDLHANLNDNSQAWLLQNNGQYIRTTAGDEPVFQVQTELLKAFAQ